MQYCATNHYMESYSAVLRYQSLYEVLQCSIALPIIIWSPTVQYCATNHYMKSYSAVLRYQSLYEVLQCSIALSIIIWSPTVQYCAAYLITFQLDKKLTWEKHFFYLLQSWSNAPNFSVVLLCVTCCCSGREDVLHKLYTLCIRLTCTVHRGQIGCTGGRPALFVKQLPGCIPSWLLPLGWK